MDAPPVPPGSWAEAPLSTLNPAAPVFVPGYLTMRPFIPAIPDTAAQEDQDGMQANLVTLAAAERLPKRLPRPSANAARGLPTPRGAASRPPRMPPWPAAQPAGCGRRQ